jgi:hypothetical protein
LDARKGAADGPLPGVGVKPETARICLTFPSPLAGADVIRFFREYALKSSAWPDFAGFSYGC